MARPLRPTPAAPRLIGDPAAVTHSLRHVGTITVLSVSGEIDLATVRTVEREALRALHEAHGRLILDLSATTFMDLDGARAARRLGRHAHTLGGQLALVAVTRGVRLALDHMPPPNEVLVTQCLSGAVHALVDQQVWWAQRHARMQLWAHGAAIARTAMLSGMSTRWRTEPGRPAKLQLTRTAPCLSAAVFCGAGALFAFGESSGTSWALLLFGSALFSIAVCPCCLRRSRPS